MTAIARELDEKLQALDPKAALSLERLVRDALDLLTFGTNWKSLER